MTDSLKKKEAFLNNFQESVIQGRKLLQAGNHHWATRIFIDLYFEIETKEWLDVQKKHQLIMILSNSWWIYLNSLKGKKKDGEFDLIKYIDAYNRFFSFLSKLEDFGLFDNFVTDLLKNFIKIENLSVEGITKFVNSFSIKVIEKNKSLKLIELQILLMYLRKSVIPTESFRFSMEHLGRIIYKLEPSRRSLFLFIVLENVNIKFNLLENSEEFIKLMNKILVNRIPNYLKTDFSNLGRISINEKTFNSIKEDLISLIEYLNNIGEASWIIIVIRSLFQNIKRFQSLGDAIVLIRQFIDYTIDRNRFHIAYEIYDFLEDLFLIQSDLGYDNVLIELWAEACKKFVNMKEKKYLLQSIEKLTNNLKVPQKNPQIFHFFYTYNYLWKFKSMFFYLEKQDFWKMLFYRALYEDNNFPLARKITSFLSKRIKSLLGDLEALYNETKDLRHQIYSLDDEKSNLINDVNFEIKNMIIRINSKGQISYRILSINNETIEGIIQTEQWNDTHIIEIYNDLFSDKKNKDYDIDLKEFGSILYLLLPKLIRDFLTQFKVRSINFIPQIYFILDHMTIPFELIYDGNFFFLKYSGGYKIGEPPIHGVNFEEERFNLNKSEDEIKNNVLIISSTNAFGPTKWNEDIKNKELLFPFPAGEKELSFITSFFNQHEKVNNIEILSDRESTKQNILEKISQGTCNIIYIVGNIFYSNLNPQNSYFITNDNNIIKFVELFDVLRSKRNRIKPLIFFNTQIYDSIGDRIEDDLRSFGEIISKFEFNDIMGIICRSYPIFNDGTKQIIANFFINLFNHNSQGISLLKARQQYMADKTAQLIEKQILEKADEKDDTHINVETSQAISSFILYGEPWKKL